MPYPPQGVGAGASPADIWGYPTRTLTQAKFPFWSAIIPGTGRADLTLAPSASATIDIQPPSGETWLVSICAQLCIGTARSSVAFGYFNGVSAIWCTSHFTGGSYGDYWPHLELTALLTDGMYARLYYYNADPTSSCAMRYGYSGLKLSRPLWSPKRLEGRALPFKKATDAPLPDPIKPLEKYKALILDPVSNEYVLGVVLEENTPLAVDEKTGFPVERMSAYVKADVLADLITKFKSGALDYAKAGYEKYLIKWKSEGIDLGVL